MKEFLRTLGGRFIWHRPVSWALLTLFVSVVSLLWYIFEGYRLQFHSDSATKILLAKEMLITGQIFPETWFYANGDLWAINSHIFVLPFLLFLPAGYLAHALGALVNAAVLLVTVFEFQKSINRNLSSRLYVTALFATGMSIWGAENLFGQYAYSIPLILVMLYLLATNKIIFAAPRTGRGNWDSYLFISLIVFFMSLSAPTRSLVYFIIPTSIALFWVLKSKNKSEPASTRKYTALAIANVGAFFMGTVCRLILATDLNLSSVASIGAVVAPKEWPSSLVNSSMNILLLLGAEGGADLPLFSADGLLTLAKYGLVAILVWLLTREYSQIFKNKGAQPTSLMIIFSFIGLGITLLIATLTNLGEPRYWQIPVSLCLIVGLANVFANIKTSNYYIQALVMALVVVNIFTVTAQPSELAFQAVKAPTTNLLTFLEKKNLTYGYASYWNADKNSVLSDGNVLIRQVLVSEKSILPFRWLSSESWYLGNASRSTFLLLSKEESLKLPEEDFRALGIKAVNTYKFEEWIIHIFDGDIAKKLEGWSSKS